jgi:predicted MFS family arabinose efflux permease
MSHSRLATNTVPLDRGASDEAACAGKLQQLLLMGSGIVAAAQIGKGVISVPMIRSDLALGLDFAGLIVATFATIGAMTGIGAGLVVSRLGAGRSLIGGMGVVTLGNLIGASAPDQRVLLFARLIEGIGFLAIYAAAPHAAPALSVVPPTIGLVQQASSLGQFAGPASLGLWVEHFGWLAAPAILAPVALLGLASAFALRRILATAEQRGRNEPQGASSPRVASR